MGILLKTLISRGGSDPSGNSPKERQVSRALRMKLPKLVQVNLNQKMGYIENKETLAIELIHVASANKPRHEAYSVGCSLALTSLLSAASGMHLKILMSFSCVS